MKRFLLYILFFLVGACVTLSSADNSSFDEFIISVNKKCPQKIIEGVSLIKTECSSSDLIFHCIMERELFSIYEDNLKLKDEIITLYYSDLNERDLDHERITKILTNPNTPTESVKGLLNTVKTKATETFNKTIEEPTGFYFEKDFNGVLTQFRKGEIANIIFKDNAYYVINKKGIKLFKAISEEGFKYGKLIY